MKLLADENFEMTSVKIPENAGFDVLSIGRDFKGILDKEVIELAIGERRTILTFDRDYGELIFKKGFKPISGVIYFRWSNFLPNEPGEYLKKLFQSEKINFEGKLTVVSDKNVRQRKYTL